MKYLSKYLCEGIANKIETIKVTTKKIKKSKGSTKVEGVTSILNLPVESCNKNLIKVKTLKWQKYIKYEYLPSAKNIFFNNFM